MTRRRVQPGVALVRRRDGLPAAALALCLAAGAAPAFDLQGHRGARGLAPENTLSAFATALGVGVSTLEMDLAVTRDGFVVVSHDARLNPDITRDARGGWLAGPGGAIQSLDLRELFTFDVGRINPASEYARRFPGQLAVDGARIPLLSSVFELAGRAGNDTVRFNLETKIDPRAPDLTLPPDAFADAVVAVVRDAGLAARVSVQSFDWRTLKRVQSVAPEIPTVCLTVSQKWLDNLQRGAPGPSAWTAGLDVDEHGGSAPRLAAAAGCRGWSPYHRELDASAVAEAHALGLTVVPWTVNETTRVFELLDMGVDGLITDYPDRARGALEARGVALPAPTPLAN